MPLSEQKKQITTLGVIADTHIPDRARSLSKKVIPVFKQAGVAAILHAGDVSSPGVLGELREIAPVYAVRGNRDWIFLKDLPFKQVLAFEGVSIGMTHGHGLRWTYIKDKFYFSIHGYNHARLLPRLQEAFPTEKVIIFGHGHIPLNTWINGQLLLNPGSPHFPGKKNLAPSIGLLHILAGGEVKGEIVYLN